MNTVVKQFTPDVLGSWKSTISTWDKSHDRFVMANEALNEIIEGSHDGIAVIESETNELRAIASYRVSDVIESEIQLLTFAYYWKSKDRLSDLLNRFHDKDGSIYLSHLAGTGKGGGEMIIKELLNITREKDKTLFLKAFRHNAEFYKKYGLRQLRPSQIFYYP